AMTQFRICMRHLLMRRQNAGAIPVCSLGASRSARRPYNQLMSAVRLVTIHPALTHFTLGALPILVIAYAQAARRPSERWTFVGDVTLFVTALSAIATVTFGLVSNGLLYWSADLARWRWLHLAFGAATTAMLVAFAAWRLIAQRRGARLSGIG